MIFNKLTSYLKTRNATILLLVLAVFALALRAIPYIFTHVSNDMAGGLLNWTNAVDKSGFGTYGTAFTDYSPLYTYILSIVSLLPKAYWTMSIKLFSIAGDITLASLLGIMVIRCYAVIHSSAQQNSDFKTFRRNLGLLAAIVYMYLPSVWLNSAMWGQCDVFWVGCCIASLFCFLKEKPNWGMFWFGLAFAFKQQALFFSPVILLLLWVGKAKWWQVLWVPAIYLATCVPCLIAGRDLASLLTVYFDQGANQETWSYSAPNFYILIRHLTFNQSIVLLIMAILAIFTIFLCWRMAKRYRLLTSAEQTRLALLFTCFCACFYPFALPCMHERYFYLCVISTLIAAFVFYDNKWLWIAAVCIEIASFSTDYLVLSFRTANLCLMLSTVPFATVAMVTLIAQLWLLKPNPEESKMKIA